MGVPCVSSGAASFFSNTSLTWKRVTMVTQAGINHSSHTVTMVTQPGINQTLHCSYYGNTYLLEVSF
jgi:hypothetical protein